VISGRSLDEVDRILEGVVTAVGAVHGLVRRTGDGVVEGIPADPALAEARVQLERFVAGHPGLMLEDKAVSVAVHSRQAPQLSATARAEAERICAGTELKLQPGELVTEIRTSGADKGAAVRAFMQEHPFKGALPVFVGDDLTDEDGFKAARALGGVSVLVGPVRPTEADLRLEDVAAVRAWLEAGLMQDAET
jgi:trehalose 6-phosphate phosphatase